MTAPDLSRARDFVLTHGRLLDRLRFAALFDGAGPAPVLRALEAYRTDSGLYAHALEPDKRSPSPQPMDQWEALRIMDEQGGGPMAPLCDALAPLTTAEGGLPFSDPSVTQAPHAPWWACEGPQPASINPTGEMLAFLWRAGVDHPWMAPAEAFCWQALGAIEPGSCHSLTNALAFLDTCPDRPRADAAKGAIIDMIRAATAFDPAAPGYVFGPLDFTPYPRSDPIYTPAELEPVLKALSSAQDADGGWPVSWPCISPVVEGECRARRTIWALDVLRRWDRLP